MSWWSKPVLRWQEPKAFVREKNAQELTGMRWWFRPVVVLLFAGMLWASSLRKHMDHSGDFPRLIPSASQGLLILGGAFILVYVMPWAIQFLPSYVSFGATALARSHGNTNVQVNYSQVASFSWEQRESYSVLTLVRRKGGRELRLGVPLDIPRETIHQLLIRHDALPLPAARCTTGSGAFVSPVAGV